MTNPGLNRRVFLSTSDGFVAGGASDARLGKQLPPLVVRVRFSNGRLSGSVAAGPTRRVSRLWRQAIEQRWR